MIVITIFFLFHVLDIVYVGAIHPVHHSLCTLMLNAGKNVLCEKPLGLNLKQVKEMTELARSKGVLFVEVKIMKKSSCNTVTFQFK